MKYYFSLFVAFLFFQESIFAQCSELSGTIEPIPFGDMEQWCVRYIKESKLIGGKTKTLYVLDATDTITANAPYDYSGTPWGISNAYANVIGIAKAACTTQPERRGTTGYCARLDTKIETVRVLGMVDIRVCIAGTLFLGSVKEPVQSADDPYGNIDMGIPFTRRPVALRLDIKANVNPEHKVVKALGFGQSVIDGHDEPEVYVYLQRRWEDNKGNIHAERVGTARHRFAYSIPDWLNGYRVEIKYGDITEDDDFKPYMDLFPKGGIFKAMNSKGKMVEINETGWAAGDAEPTHVIVMITGGCYPAFYGAPGNALWVDNVCWEF